MYLHTPPPPHTSHHPQSSMPEVFFNEIGVEISDEQAEKIFTPKEAIEFMKTFLDIHDH